MKPRLDLWAIIDTTGHADTIINSVRNELSGKDVFEEHSLIRTVNDAGQIELNFDFRFNSSDDRNAVRTWAKDQIKDHPVVKTWIVSARLSRHECPHDEISVIPCNKSNYVLEYEK